VHTLNTWYYSHTPNAWYIFCAVYLYVLTYMKVYPNAVYVWSVFVAISTAIGSNSAYAPHTQSSLDHHSDSFQEMF